jgi:hypothetical protein
MLCVAALSSSDGALAPWRMNPRWLAAVPSSARLA